MTFQKTILKEISTSKTERPSSPNIIIKNPLQKDIFVNGIELILSAEFSKKGKLVILVNEVSVFDEEDSKDLFGYSKFPIPLGKKLKRSFKIEIFAWNGSGDSNTIKMKLNTSIAEDLQPFNSQAESLGQDVFNQIVSQGETLFPNQARQIGSFTKLVDMEGYKKLIVYLSKASTTIIGGVPVVSITFGLGDPSNLDRATDGDFASVTGEGGINTGTTGEIKLDTGSNTNRFLKVKHRVRVLGGGAGANCFIDTSPDDVVYTNKFTKAYADGTDTTEIVDCTEHTFRYIKLRYTEAGNQAFISWFEIFDALFNGGIGAISFEVRNPLTGDFSQLIPASEFGTITDGINDVVKQVGDVTTVSVSGKTYALPSTQTDFRAKYSLTVGALTNSVTILKVA